MPRRKKNPAPTPAKKDPVPAPVHAGVRHYGRVISHAEMMHACRNDFYLPDGTDLLTIPGDIRVFMPRGDGGARVWNAVKQRRRN